VTNKFLEIESSNNPGIALHNSSANGRQFFLYSHRDAGGASFRIFDASNNVDRFTIDENGNVGIGTSTPSSKTSILFNNSSVYNEGALNSGANDLLTLENTNSTTGAFAGLRLRANSADAGIGYVFNGTANSGYMVFITDGQASGRERMRIMDNGNIGIGTTAPSTKLQVTASTDPLKLEGLQNDASLDTVVTVDTDGVLHKTAVTDLSDGDWTVDGDTLYSAPDSAVVIKEGNTGIGTLSPAKKLHVISDQGDVARIESSNGNATIQLYNANGGSDAPAGTIAGRVDFSARHNNSAAAEIARVSAIYQGNGTTRSGDLLFHTSLLGNPTERMRVSSSGFVGIGTSSPAFKLDVNNTNNLSEGIRVSNTNSNSNAATVIALNNDIGTVGFLAVGSSNNSVSRVQNRFSIGNSVGDGISFRVNTGDNFLFYTNETEIAEIDANGNWSIGSTSPTNRLHVVANSDPLKLEGLQNDASLDTVITVDTDGVLHKTAVTDLSDGDWTVDGDTLYSAPDSAVVIKDGNVGIGTLDPVDKLEIVDGSVRSTASSTGNFTSYTALGTASFPRGGYLIGDADSSFTNAAFWVAPASSSQITTTVEALTNSNTSTTNTKRVGIRALTTETQLYSASGTGNSGDVPLKVYPNGIAGNPSTTFLTNGNVGIGTTTPQGILEIADNAKYTMITDPGASAHFTINPSVLGGQTIFFSDNIDFRIQGYANRGSTSGDARRMHLDGDGRLSIGDNFMTPTTDARIYTAFSGSSGNAEVSAHFDIIDSDSDTVLRLTSEPDGAASSTNQFLLAASYSNNPVMHVRGDGNVGIGTTTPARSLEISGGGSNVNEYLRISGTNTNVSNNSHMGIEFYNSDNTVGAGVHAAILSEAEDFGEDWMMKFVTGKATGPDTAMTIRSGGNIGIGTDLPNNKLHISASSDPLKLEGLQNDGSIDTVVTVDTDGVLHKTAATDLDDGDWTVSGDTLYSSLDSTITIKNGRVGIGTTDPKTSLHIYDDGVNPVLRISRAGFTGNPTTQLSHGYVGTFGSDGFEIYGGGISRMIFHNTGFIRMAPTTFYAINSDQFYLDVPSGFIGIGTNSPAEILHIDADSDSLQIDNLAGTGNVLSIDANGKVFKANASSMAVTNVSSNAAATSAQEVLLVDATSGSVTITLPATSAVSTGKTYHIKKTDGTANNVIIDGNGAETIDGALNQTSNVPYGGWKIVSDGSNWMIIGKF
ncbi:MAG: hypothetical protein MRY83_10080, partial [Flavobacteriales bacterium]|nr:hypothetical protein [Flavobacteriales bacterium]